MTIVIEKPSSADMQRYLSYMQSLELAISTQPNHHLVPAWQKDLDYYRGLYEWANDSYHMYLASKNKRKKTFLERLFGL